MFSIFSFIWEFFASIINSFIGFIDTVMQIASDGIDMLLDTVSILPELYTIIPEDIASFFFVIFAVGGFVTLFLKVFVR